MFSRKNFNKIKNIARFYSQPGYKIVQKAIQGYTDYPFQIREALKNHGDEVIHTMVIFRIPLSSTLRTAINVASFGQFEDRVRNSPYEKLFHLGLYINNKYIFEKAETVFFKSESPKGDGIEFMQVNNIPSGLTIAQLIERTKDKMGIREFVGYNAIHNNCQAFVSQVLIANGMMSEQYKHFIYQDVATIFEGLHSSRKTMNTFTHIGNSMNMLMNGDGLDNDLLLKLSKSRKMPSRKLLKLGVTTDTQLIEFARKLGFKLVDNRVFMKDQLPENLKEGNYIINLQSSYQGDGTHWVAFLKSGRDIYYCDSFGCPPPQNEMNIFRDNHLLLYYNYQQHQAIDADSCGYWAIMWLYYMNNVKFGSLYSQRFMKWNKEFSNDYKENEKKLLKMVNKHLY